MGETILNARSASVVARCAVQSARRSNVFASRPDCRYGNSARRSRSILATCRGQKPAPGISASRRSLPRLRRAAMMRPSDCFPSSGPRVRDRHQVRMIEALLRDAHARWEPRLEVPVYHPVRGVIDLVLHDRETDDLVAGEGHSELSAVDAQIRWARQKADALPSANGWPWSDARRPKVMRLLLLRDTARCASSRAACRRRSRQPIRPPTSRPSSRSSGATRRGRAMRSSGSGLTARGRISFTAPRRSGLDSVT